MKRFFLSDDQGKPVGEPLSRSKRFAFRLQRVLGFTTAGLVEVTDFSVLYPVSEGEWAGEPRLPVDKPLVRLVAPPRPTASPRPQMR